MEARGLLAELSCALACASACTINPEFDSPAASSEGSEAGSESPTATSAPSTTSEPSSSSDGEEAGSETAVVCGDGVVEGAEQCDDANDIDGDGCNAGCIEGGALLWELRKDGGVAGWDTTHDLAVLADDSVVLAGVADTGGLQAELARVDANGNELWSHLYVATDATEADAWGTAPLGDGAVLAGTGNNEVMFARALDQDGNALWTFEAPGRVYDASSSGDEVWIAGRHDDGTAALWHLDGEGTLVATYDEASGSMPTTSVVWGIAAGDGRVATAGELMTDQRAFVRELWSGSGGVARETDVLALAGDADAGYGVTIAQGGAIAMVGDIVRGSERNGWLLRRDTGGRLLPAIEQQELGNYHGVAIGPSGEIAVSGWVDNGLGKIALVVKYAVDGTLAWRREITGSVVVGENKAWTVGIRSDAVIVAAGELVETDTDLDRWVIAFAP